MIQTNDITRPPAAWSKALQGDRRRDHHRDVVPPSACAIPSSAADGVDQGQGAWPGPALTLQFMPKREDLYGDDEYDDPEQQLHRHVLYHAQPGDMVVVDARGDMASGVFGEMMLTYFKGRGGAGVVIDGCIRDFGRRQELDLGLWLRGATPNFHAQTDLMPFAVNVPIACGGALVMPGDIIVADDDGAVVVPVKLAEQVIKAAGTRRMGGFSPRAAGQGGDLRRYYPLSDAARPEYEAWLKAKGKKA